MLRATAALLVGAPEEFVLKPVYPDAAQLNRLRDTLMKRQLSIFAEIQPWELGKVVTADSLITPPDRCNGQIEKG